jgi:single-strand DNA-binding protein
MNKTILIGRITANPELRTTQSGNQNTTFSLAVNRNYTKEDGTRETDFINCTAWQRTAENIVKYCSKGSQIAVEGRIQIRSYDAQDGTKRYVTEVLVEQCTFLGAKVEAGDKEKDIVKTNEIDPFADFGNEVALSDDDLPF